MRWPNNKTNGSFSSSKISKEAVNDVGSTTNATDQAAGNSRCRKGHRANSGGAEERDMVALGRGIAIPRDGNKNFNVINDRKDGLSAVSHLRATNSRDDVAWASGSAENLNELSDFHIPTCSECEGVTWNKMIDELRGALSRQMEVVTAGEKMVNAQREFEPLREEVGRAGDENDSIVVVRDDEHIVYIRVLSMLGIYEKYGQVSGDR